MAGNATCEADATTVVIIQAHCFFGQLIQTDPLPGFAIQSQRAVEQKDSQKPMLMQIRAGHLPA